MDAYEVTIAVPRPWVQDTDNPPKSEQIRMYQIMVLSPCFGATNRMMINAWEVSEGQYGCTRRATVLTCSKADTPRYKEPRSKKQDLEICYRRNGLVPGTIQGNNCRPKLKQITRVMSKTADGYHQQRRTIHSAHASQPKVVSFSSRNQLDMIAQITTDKEPKGVCAEIVTTRRKHAVMPRETHDHNGFDESIGTKVHDFS